MIDEGYDVMAFVFIEYDKDYDDPPCIIIHKDDKQVLLYEVYEGGYFELEEYVEDITKIKSGYYKIDYNFYMEEECWEMPNVRYPVIDEFYIEPFRFGWFYKAYLEIKYFITRTSVYIN